MFSLLKTFRLFFICCLAVTASLTKGCGMVELELGNRGGYLDHKLDSYWWTADTKQMRVLRAYVLIGAVTRLANTKHDAERTVLAKQVGVAVGVASEAFNCAYVQPGRCIFFDERMIELEVQVLRLLSAVVSAGEEEELFKGLNKYLQTTMPLLKSFDTFAKLADAATSTGELGTSVAKIVASLFKVGQNAYFTGRRIGALYRDTIELQMVTALKSLDTICAIQRQQTVKYDVDGRAYHRTSLPLSPPHAEKAPPSSWAFTSSGNAPVKTKGKYSQTEVNAADKVATLTQFYGLPSEMPRADACAAYATGHKMWQRGAGDMKEWSQFLSVTVQPFVKWLIPAEESFIQASDLIWRSCEHLTSSVSERSQCIGRLETSEDKTECAVNMNEVSPTELKVVEKKGEPDTPAAQGKAMPAKLAPKKAVLKSNQAADTAKDAPNKNQPKTPPAKSDPNTAEAAKAAKKVENRGNWCRLILYPKVASLRATRVLQGRANARISWLSEFTASPAHPLPYHPGQRVPPAPHPQ